MSIKIEIGKYVIRQTDFAQYTVGETYYGKDGRLVPLRPHYFPSMTWALDYVRQKLVLEKDIKTVDDLKAANESAMASMKFWVATTPMKDLEVPAKGAMA
ncbi:hypothetical protein [Lacticaseibacillus parakribbianus]|uniref:hypothetical protein n=1 Tax=Lacticaseibacillus parakribbianus TaxID=2970927 RepID=UPI0021CB700C|nr:hypothetical protein [Lacticaseibacillus parakribbianus]